MQARSSSPPPLKRSRRAASPLPEESANGHASGSGQYLQPLALSILGVEPLDEFIKEIADFVHHMIKTRPDYPNGKVEVEAKVGVLRDRSSGQRLGLPVLVETILAPMGADSRFESNMSIQQHKHYNTLLNQLKTASSQPDYGGSPVDYSHQYLTDTFYTPDGNDRDKVRVTRDDKTNTVLETMRKIRLGDLNVYSPKQSADWRVSVNLEVPEILPPVPHPIGTASFTRKKDRLSYSHQEFKIDLTQVTSTTSPNATPQILHELELEIARPDFLLATALKRGDPNVSEHERSAFDELIRAFVNNARILVRNASDGWQ
ncbi:mRNA capping enzyme [Pholiota conissans]|uniref:mRNA-capping enzyme subunit beta n=1 Tax=Pholiota conissans TaxID=109636 RepID=A0A9P5Z874_9AGAR|nr:mRNA capping enzyme [Pholiota conissans]